MQMHLSALISIVFQMQCINLLTSAMQLLTVDEMHSTPLRWVVLDPDCIYIDLFSGAKLLIRWDELKSWTLVL